MGKRTSGGGLRSPAAPGPTATASAAARSAAGQGAATDARGGTCAPGSAGASGTPGCGGGGSAGGGGQPKLSGRLLGMKFMQRGQERAVLAQAVEAQAAKEDEAHWVAAAAAAGGGCCVIQESDPPPGAVSGHLSFGAFNPAAEKLQAEREAALQALRRQKKLGTKDEQGAAVSDADMARALKRHKPEGGGG